MLKKRKLMIACALIGKPDLIIMDEPFNGLDQESIQDIRLLIQSLSREGVAFLITSHNIPELQKVVNRFGILYKGQLIKEYDTERLLEEQDLIKVDIKSDNVDVLIKKLSDKYNRLLCVSDSIGCVSVISCRGEEEFEQVRKLYENMGTKVTEEDVLRWEMSGFRK